MLGASVSPLVVELAAQLLLKSLAAAADPWVLCALLALWPSDLHCLLLVIPAAADQMVLCALPAPWPSDLVLLNPVVADAVCLNLLAVAEVVLSSMVQRRIGCFAVLCFLRMWA